MSEDRLKRDYDNVENLSDLIEAREERSSASADDVDAMEDLDVSELPDDPQKELSYPHKHGPTRDEAEGTDINLLDTPDQRQIEFDWQDSVEEMLPTDPHPEEGMGEDVEIQALSHVEAEDLAGPVPSVNIDSELDTAATEEEEIKYDLDGGREECEPAAPLLPIESAMETDSDEEDFRIADKFEGELDRETALLEAEELRHATEGEGEE